MMMTISGNFAKRGKIVPDFIMNVPGLTLGSRVLYGTLCNSAGEKDYCWPSQAYLAKSINQSIRSVQNHLKELAKAGFIRVGKRPLRGNLYHLLMHPAVGCKEDRGYAHAAAPATTQPTRATSAATSASENTRDLGVREKSAQGINIKERQERPPSPPQPLNHGEADAAFQQVWDVWPVHEARKSALRLWQHLWRSDERPQLAKILESIKENLARNPRWKRGFIPFLATWLKDRRWEDELPLENATCYEPHTSCESQPKAGRQREEVGGKQPPVRIGALNSGGQSTQHTSSHVHDVFQEAMAVWPGQMTKAEAIRAKGLWNYLFSKGQLPTFEEVLGSARTASINLLWWLNSLQTGVCSSAA